VSKVLRILRVIGLRLATPLAEAAGEIGAREGAVQIAVCGGLGYVRCGVEIGGEAWREGGIARLGCLKPELLGRRTRGAREQRRHQRPIGLALVKFVECVTTCCHMRHYTGLLGSRAGEAEWGGGARPDQSPISISHVGKNGMWCSFVFWAELLTYERGIVLDAVMYIDVG
jgi:hypothetical protein